MATLQELRGLFNDSDLMEKVEAATVISANDLISGTPTVDEQKWAAAVFGGPRQESKKAMLAIIAENNGLSTSAILGASDGAIKTQVSDVVSTLVVAHAA